jgi:hypothetical protein
MIKKASEILAGFLDNAQLEKAENYNSFFRSWKTIVGLDIASHTRVHEIEGWKLIVQADHPGWAQKIEWKKRSILKEIGKRYPELGIRDIRIWIVEKLTDQPVQHGPPASDNSDNSDNSDKEEMRQVHPPTSSVGAPESEESGQKLESSAEGSEKEAKEALDMHLKTLGKLIKEADKKRRH